MNSNSKKSRGSNSVSSAIKKELFSYAIMFAFSFAFALFFNNAIIVNAQIISGSMENGINISDRLVGSRLSYKFSEPQRGDVVIFLFPDNESDRYVKRIIGLPGDIIEIKSGVLYINEEVYEEDYLKEPMTGSFGPYFVPANSFFMLGDNRNVSIDSRFWKNKYVSKDKILGKALFKYYSSFEFIE